MANKSVDYRNFNTWEEVSEFIDEYPLEYNCSTLAEIGSGKYPVDAFSLGQLASKSWMLNQYNNHAPHQQHIVALLGCWLGTIVQPLFRINKYLERIWGFDSDPQAVNLANQFNNQYHQGWKFLAVIEDVNTQDWNDPEFVVDQEIITQRPDVIINTSCEHMNQDWFQSVKSDQLIIMQTNDYHGLPEHINTCVQLEDMQTKYPLRNTLYLGSMKTPLYTRFMQIGYK